MKRARNPLKATRKEIAAARRQAVAERRHRLRTRKYAEKLIVLLQEFIQAHYGDPSTGRTSEVFYAQMLASLQAAASLRALLILALEAKSAHEYRLLAPQQPEGRRA